MPLTPSSTNSEFPAPLPKSWKVSLHGGHSGEFCDHAQGSLSSVVDAAIAAGYDTFGISEHAPRYEAAHLYPEEVARGWNVDTLLRIFDDYAARMDKLIPEYAGRITLLKGFEAEVVPRGRYVELMQGLRDHYEFEYIVGSVHWLGGVIMDYNPELFRQAVTESGSLEALCLNYYRAVGEMAEALKPEVVGHLDLPRKYVARDEDIETPAIRAAAEEALEVIARHGCILDLNTAGYRKGLGHPYPGPWLLRAAHARGIPFCFGDDSHGPQDVGAGVAEARRYLLELGVPSVTVLTRGKDGKICRQVESLGKLEIQEDN